jgi:hypothetical protein
LFEFGCQRDVRGKSSWRWREIANFAIGPYLSVKARRGLGGGAINRR